MEHLFLFEGTIMVFSWRTYDNHSKLSHSIQYLIRIGTWCIANV